MKQNREWPLHEIMILQRNTGNQEIGGLLLSTSDSPGWIAIQPAHNIAENPKTAFTLDPHDVYETVKAAENTGLKVTGIYHTHPCGPPRPSQTDIQGMNSWPTTWLIATPRGEYKCYQLTEETPKEVPCKPGSPMN